MLVAALLRVFRLGHQSLWVDEIMSWGNAYIGERMTLERVLENIHGPFYGLILHAWGNLAGESEWSLRFPAVVAGVAAVPVIAAVARRWLGGAAAGWAAWAMAASPFLVWYGQEARNYALVVLCACLASLALLRLRSRWSAGTVAGYLAASAAGVLSNFSFVFLAPLHLYGWIAGVVGARRKWMVAGIVALGLGLVMAPWIPRVAATWDVHRLVPGVPGEAGPPLRGETTFHWAAVPFAVHGFAAGYGWGPPVRELRRGSPLEAVRRHAAPIAGSTAVFGALGVLGLRALFRRGRLLEGLLWAVVPILILSWVAAMNVKVFHPRYVAVAVPGLYLILAAGLADLGPRLRAGFALAVAAIWAVSLQHQYFDPRYGKEDIRAAAALLAERGRPGERVIAANTESVLSYYYRGPMRVEPFWLGFAGNPARLEAELSESVAGTSGAWVVMSRAEDLDPTGAFARALEARYPGAEAFPFEGVKVWHVRPDSVRSAKHS